MKEFSKYYNPDYTRANSTPYHVNKETFYTTKPDVVSRLYYAIKSITDTQIINTINNDALACARVKIINNKEDIEYYIRDHIANKDSTTFNFLIILMAFNYKKRFIDLILNSDYVGDNGDVFVSRFD